jgi:hypothetical protein
MHLYGISAQVANYTSLASRAPDTGSVPSGKVPASMAEAAI